MYSTVCSKIKNELITLDKLFLSAVSFEKKILLNKHAILLVISTCVNNCNTNFLSNFLILFVF